MASADAMCIHHIKLVRMIIIACHLTLPFVASISASLKFIPILAGCCFIANISTFYIRKIRRLSWSHRLRMREGLVGIVFGPTAILADPPALYKLHSSVTLVDYIFGHTVRPVGNSLGVDRWKAPIF